jgi:hypothetical protein
VALLEVGRFARPSFSQTLRDGPPPFFKGVRIMLISHNTPSTPQHIPDTQQNRKRYAICKEFGVFIKVLCVYTEPCANARREVRGDLQDGVPVASALSPQA